MIASIEKLFVFPVYHTRELVPPGTGLPAYNPTLKVKSWFDPNPPAADEDGNVSYLMIAATKDGETALARDGKPYLRQTVIPRTEAMTLNIPPKAPNKPDLPQIGEWQVPCRPLADDEELFFAYGGRPEVRKKTAAPTAQPVPGASIDLTAIKEGLDNIKAKLDILLALRQ